MAISTNSSSSEENNNNNQKWVEVVPHGLIDGIEEGLSLVVFKEKRGEKRFAIWLSKLQTQIAIKQGFKKENIFSFLNPFFKSLNLFPKTCYFKKNKEGGSDIIIHFVGGARKLKFTVNASECVSFCIHHNCQFFCTHEFIESIREVKSGNLSKKIKRESPLSLN